MAVESASSLKPIGTLVPRTATEIASSRIGIGFECLDRKMWDDTDEAYRLVHELGAKHARVQSGWSLCEQEPGVYDFAWLDRIVDTLRGFGIQPWFNLVYGNILHTDTEHPDAVGWAPIRSDEQKRAWAAYVAALVQHFRGRVTHYEIWNEADHDPFWVGGADPREYMDLVRHTVPAIRENDPDARIIGGAMSRGLTQFGQAFLDACLKEGLAELIDVLSYHRYHLLPELHRPTDVAAMRATLKAYGGEHIELWQGESGCPSVPSPTQALANAPVSEEMQAEVLARSLLSDLLNGLDYTCYFHFSDFKFYYQNGFCDVPNYFGLLTFDDPPRCKPSYHVMRNLCSLFDGETVLNPRGTVELGYEGMYESLGRYAFQEKIVAIKTGVFERRGMPLAVWWYPGNPIAQPPTNESTEPRPINIHIWTPDSSIQDPVVIDPMTGQVFAVDFSTTQFIEGTAREVKLSGVPLQNTPLIATDRSVVNELLRPDFRYDSNAHA